VRCKAGVDAVTKPLPSYVMYLGCFTNFHTHIEGQVPLSQKTYRNGVQYNTHTHTHTDKRELHKFR